MEMINKTVFSFRQNAISDTQSVMATTADDTTTTSTTTTTTNYSYNTLLMSQSFQKNISSSW